MFYGQYKGRCLGCLLKYIAQYAGTHIASHVILSGNGLFTLYREPFATYIWLEDDTPYFVFSEAYTFLNMKQKEKKREVDNG